jgi:hypothetical protein
MGTPASNNGTKTVRVKDQTHKRLMDLAERLDGNADDALNFLLGESTVRVPVSDIQRKRWSDAAHDAGVSLAEFVKMRVEGALQYGADPAGLQQIYDQVKAIARFVGMRRRSVDQSTPDAEPRGSNVLPVHATYTERQS